MGMGSKLMVILAVAAAVFAAKRYGLF